MMAVGLAFSFTLQTGSVCYQACMYSRSTMPTWWLDNREVRLSMRLLGVCGDADHWLAGTAVGCGMRMVSAHTHEQGDLSVTVSRMRMRH